MATNWKNNNTIDQVYVIIFSESNLIYLKMEIALIMFPT